MSTKWAYYIYSWVNWYFREVTFSIRIRICFQWRKTEIWMTKNPIVCFLIHITSLNWATTYGGKGDTEGKGKVGQHLPTFSLSYSLLIRYRILIQCAYIKKRNLKAELVLCSISTVLVRMKYIHTYDLWNTNCATTLILHTSNLHLTSFCKM